MTRHNNHVSPESTAIVFWSGRKCEVCCDVLKRIKGVVISLFQIGLYWLVEKWKWKACENTEWEHAERRHASPVNILLQTDLFVLPAQSLCYSPIDSG